MAEQKLLLGNIRGPQGEAGPNEVSTSTTTSGFEDGHVLFNNNGHVDGKKLTASDVGAQPTMSIKKATVTPKNGFEINSRNYVVSYGPIYIANIDFKVPNSIPGGWIDVFTTDLPACKNVTVRLARGAKSTNYAESRDVQFHGDRVEIYLETEDAGRTILGTIVSYK